MPDPKQHIVDLAHICYLKGIHRVVISPGSRNAPLIRAFAEVFNEACLSIVDERSAAYFALGVAASSRMPVALVCTSGTAVLNYAPALAEAFHQHVPLLAITADRPAEWIGQQANQTIRQDRVFRNYVKASYGLPQTMASEDDVWYAQRIINEAINLCQSPQAGPVHINVPLAEPLYETLPPPSDPVRVIREVRPDASLVLPSEMIDAWQRAKRILIIHGQDHYHSEAASLLSSLSEDEGIAVLAENIANVPGRRIIANSHLVLRLNRYFSPVQSTGHENQASQARPGNPGIPDLILHSGGHVVSAALGKYLHSLPPTQCWRIGTDKTLLDTFQKATHVIHSEAPLVYRALLEKRPAGMNSDFAGQWQWASAKANALLEEKILSMPFSDTKVCQSILSSLPPETVVMAGNSSVVRYLQLFPANGRHCYFANRGVSGIDGCISTAAGIAHASKKLTLAITGDLAFLYDSNGLWNSELPTNLRIVVINNGGGGIFHLLKGPADMKEFGKFVETRHPVNIRDLAAAFHVDHYFSDNETDMEKQWERFMQASDRAAVFEIKTDPGISATSYRQIMKSKVQ